jgi:hypothetical protein
VPPVLHFPEYRQFEAARVEANDAMMALLIGSRLGRHALGLAEGSPHLLGTLFPTVPEIGRLNRSVEDTRLLIDGAERYLAYMAIPYSLSVYSTLLSDGVALLRDAGVDHGDDDPRDIALSEIHARFVAAAGGDLTDFPQVHLRLFEFARWVRNRIVHRGGTPGSRLSNQYRQVLSEDDRVEWRRIARRDPPFGDGSEQMDLRSQELRVVLAITKHLAESANAVLRVKVPRTSWARVVVSDYEQSSGHSSAGRIESVRGYARMNYGPLMLDEDELSSAIDARTRKDGRSTD